MSNDVKFNHWSFMVVGLLGVFLLSMAIKHQSQDVMSRTEFLNPVENDSPAAFYGYQADRARRIYSIIESQSN